MPDSKARCASLSPDQRCLPGPFDIIGDVHGCFRELQVLLTKLGYSVPVDPAQINKTTVKVPAGRRIIFVGDLVDRGEDSIIASQIVMGLVSAGVALSVRGNHDDKFLRWLRGNKVSLSHGLEGTIDDLARNDQVSRHELEAFFEALPYYLWLADGQLVVAHAGIRESMLGQSGPAVRSFCLYGDTSNERDASGLPTRYHWAAAYDGQTTIVYGHTPVKTADWVNNTLCIDTGCCFGGALTALRWPEHDLVSVKALQTYASRLRPFGHPPARADLR